MNESELLKQCPKPPADWDERDVFHIDICETAYAVYAVMKRMELQPGAEAWKDYDEHRIFLKRLLIEAWSERTGIDPSLWPVPDHMMGALWTKVRKLTNVAKQQRNIPVA